MPEETQFDFDVFITYSSKDKAWVRGELLKRIEQAGLKAFIDFRDFTRGAPSISECERGVVQCRKTLLVLTPNYIESGWGEIENIMVQTLDPANRELRLIPLLKSDCKKPLRIGALTHIDFTDGADLDLAWRQLLTALGKPPEPEPPKEPARDEWFLAHPYPMPPNFTGRLAERAMLTRWLADATHPLLSLRALGGFGKSALVWHWLTHDVAPATWPRVVWWSFYEGDASFDHFLAETLHYLSGRKTKPDRLSVDEVRMLLELLHPPGTLLVLDGFERALRAFSGFNAAYQGDEVAADGARLSEPQKPRTARKRGNSRAQDPAKPLRVGDPRSDADRDCVSPLAELFLYNVALQPHLRSKVLLTTRLCPRVLEAKGGGFLQGCRDEELRQMQPADAVEFFRAQGIRGTHTEIEAACEPYGYHPLSLRLLAGLIVGDFQQPGDIAAAKRLDVSGDLVQRQHHVLETAYNSLTPARQALLGRIACFRSPVKYEALKALAETRPLTPSLSPDGGEGDQTARAKRNPLAPIGGEGARRAGEGERSDETKTLDADLRDLVARGLLHHDTKEGRFDLHPIVRRYAYDRLAAPDRAAAHTRLRDYFAAVPPPDTVTRLEDLAPVIELYHHTVRAGQFDEAQRLFRDRLDTPTYYQFGAYHLQIDLLRALFPDGEERPPRLKDERERDRTLTDLACVYSLTGQPRRAVQLFEQDIAYWETKPDKSNLARGLTNVAEVQLMIGALRAAEANLGRSIALCRWIQDELWEAVGHQDLGMLLAYRGAYPESETELAAALGIFEKPSQVQAQGVTWAYRALRELLLLRSDAHSALCVPRSALDSASRALELADETARTQHPYELDYVRAHWLLGAAHRVAGQLDEAEKHLHEALERCRRINAVWVEADILIDLARLRAATPSTGSGQAAPDEAQRLAEEALLITERSGYVLQGADAHLELAKLALNLYPVGPSCRSAKRRGSAALPEVSRSFPDLVAEAVRRASPEQRKLALEHAQEARRLATCDGPPDYTYKAAYDEAGVLLKTLGGR